MIEDSFHETSKKNKEIYKKNYLIYILFSIIIAFLMLSIIQPYFSNYLYTKTSPDLKNIPPVLKLYNIEDNCFAYLHKDYYLIECTKEGEIIGRFPDEINDIANKRYVYKINDKNAYVDYDLTDDKKQPDVVIEEKKIRDVDLVWNKSYRLGTDSLGRDILTRIMRGTKNSLLIALFATLLNTIIGLIVGALSGYFGGTTDAVLMRIVDCIATVPSMIIVIIILATFGNTKLVMVFTMGITHWVKIARVIRNQILSIRNFEFIEASFSMNASNSWILRKHLFPNVLPHLITCITLIIPEVIFGESTLGFLGLGLHPPEPSLGLMLSEGSNVLRTHTYQLLIPSIILIVIVLIFNLIGDFLENHYSVIGGYDYD